MKSKRFTVLATAIVRPALSISFRLLIFNVLLVFLPIAAVLYLDVYEDQLLVSQEKTMVQQGRILAAALGGEKDISAEKVKSILDNLAGRTETRLRVLDREAMLLGDTSSPSAVSDGDSGKEIVSPGYRSLDKVQNVLGRDSFLYRAATWPVRVYRKLFNPPLPVGEPDDYDASLPFRGTEVKAALEGRYGATTRLSSGGQRSVTLYTAIPVYSGNEVIGVVLSSQSTYRILRDLYEVRLVILRIFLASMAAAVAISFFLSSTISLRIRKLSREARSITTGKGRISGSFSPMKLDDEIGALSRSLIDLTGRLDRHIRFIDTLSRDISHEFKNPLAVISSAAEMVDSAEGGEKARFAAMIRDNAKRMESLLDGVEEISRLDSRLEREEREPLDAVTFLSNLLGGFRLRYPRLGWTLNSDGGEAMILASPERFSQIFINLYENASTFAEETTDIHTEISSEKERIQFRVCNRGPNIPEEDLERIFDRFYTTREGEKGCHHGLGLSIVRTIVENYGGTITAQNRPVGPCFILTFPRV